MPLSSDKAAFVPGYLENNLGKSLSSVDAVASATENSFCIESTGSTQTVTGKVLMSPSGGNSYGIPGTISAYNDTLIICAHNYESHFGKIKNLAPGSKVYFTDIDGNNFSYEVVEICILDPYAIEEMQSGDWDLTLFTCTWGGRTRVTVRCVKC